MIFDIFLPLLTFVLTYTALYPPIYTYTVSYTHLDVYKRQGQVSAPILHLSIWQRPVFLLNSRLGLFAAAPLRGLPFSRSYGVILPSSLTTLLPLALEFSSHLPVSVCGTDIADIHMPFLARSFICFPTLISVPFARGYHRPGQTPVSVSACLNLLTATEFLPYVHRLRLPASP